MGEEGEVRGKKEEGESRGGRVGERGDVRHREGGAGEGGEGRGNGRRCSVYLSYLGGLLNRRKKGQAGSAPFLKKFMKHLKSQPW